MFTPRTEFADNEELLRQKSVQRVVFGEEPFTTLEKKAAAIVRHKAIDFIKQTQILAILDRLDEYCVNDDDIENPDTQKRLRAAIKSIQIPKASAVLLPVKPPILARLPESAPNYNFHLETITGSTANLREFEDLCFGGKTRFKYYKDTSFASYLYQNILYFMNASSIEELRGNLAWQARLAVLLDQTNKNDLIATAVFYDNEVSYLGVSYDSSFVPKYDVRDLIPLSPTFRDRRSDVSDERMIEYRDNLDVHETTMIDPKYIGIFLTFPFKDGHYITPTGQIVYPSILPPKNKTSYYLTNRLCDVSEIEYAVESVARFMNLDEAVSCALYANSMLQQAVALMILRRMVGEYLRLGSFDVQLPSEHDVLSWTSLSCSNDSLILPIESTCEGHTTTSNSAENSIALIKDIAASCVTCLGASMLCSSYRLLELDLSSIYRALSTDAQKYVFYTILLQDYPIAMYAIARKRLRPTFGRENIDISVYPKNVREYHDSTLQDRLGSYTQTLVRPVDMNSEISSCPPYKCPELYEFANPQLQELVRTGDTRLDDVQRASFVSLFL